MRYESKDFKGLTPAIDLRKSDDLFALAGRNYAMDVFGPKSAFGNRFLTAYPIGKPEHVQGCRLRLRTGAAGADRVFTMTGDSILEWREDLGGWRYIYLTPDTRIQPYRWSSGYLNGLMYFCHPAVGILVYDVEADLCQPLVGPGVPTDAIGLCVNNGRLIAFDDIFYYWSAPGDGTDFRPRLGGAGFQKINERVGGFPIAVSNYARGTLLWTTGGVMRSEFTADASAYRHRAQNTEFRPINSFCVLQLDDNTVVILDERGLFKSQGESPEAYTPLFNEFLIDYLQRNDLKLGTNVRIEWDDLKRYLYVSVSLSETNPVYERALVLYPSMDKWGTFDEEHFGILPWLVQGSSRGDDYFGFVGVDGRPRYWDYVGSREILPTDPTLNSHYPLIQDVPSVGDGGDAVILGSVMAINTFEDSGITDRAGYFPRDGMSPAPSNLIGLDSVVQLGLIRGRGDVSLDQMTEITNVIIGSVLSEEENQTVEDFNLIPNGVSDEDYNEETGGEDFGFETLNYINSKLRVIGTVDGHQVFTEQIPELVKFLPGVRYFSCSVVGLWLIVELKADEIGEAFHVKIMELTTQNGGVYN